MLQVDPEFRSFIPPLSDAEKADLETSLTKHGCTDPLVTWRGLIVDGHNRFEICQRSGIPFATRELDASDCEAVKAWMFEHQIARRNLSEDQLVMLAALRGVPTKRGTERKRTMAAELASKAPERAAAVIAGRYSIALGWGALQPRKPRPPRGPSAK